MKSKTLGLLAVGLLTGPMAARAAMITELFQVTLPYATGVYAAGHVFEFTVSYDDAGTVMHDWNDGVNGIGELGSGDDTLSRTLYLSDPNYVGFTLFSDAQISISGLAALPVGSTSHDRTAINFARYYEYGDANANGFYRFGLSIDDLFLDVYQYGPAASHRQTYLYLNEYYRSAAGGWAVRIAAVSVYGGNIISRSAVPEPGSLALLGLGLIGLGVTRRRAA